MIIDADEFQFVLSDTAGPDIVVMGDLPGDLVTDDAVLSVGTGAQFGPVEVTAAFLTDAPPVGPEWEEVVEFSARVSGGLSVGELFGDQGLLTVAPTGGELRVRVSARGRAAGRGGPYDELAERQQSRTAIERFRIEAWPARVEPAQLVRGSIPAPAREDPALWRCRLPTAHAGITAGRRVGAAVTAGQVLSGATGTARAERDFGDRPSLLWRYLADVGGWLSCIGGVGRQVRVGATGMMQCREGQRHPDHLFCGSASVVSYDLLVLDEPSHSQATWDWRCPTHPERFVPYSELVPVLARPSLLDVVLEPLGQGCTVRIEHRQLPSEWVEDMAAFWVWQLEALDNLYDLQNRRERGR